MTGASLTTVIDRLQAQAVEELSDGHLLERFTATLDETAFAALVRRHGGLVLGVGRRLLGSGPDLDDVFQATFLVLARKATSIRKQASVASWLYGVAYRLARDVKQQRDRRRRREQTVDAPLDGTAETKAMPSDPVAIAGMRELGAILDDEIQRLPAGCREALVLCFMEGLSHTEAASQLGWQLGTLKGRLQRARQLLRARLQRRGVALSAVALGVVLAEKVRAAPPAAALVRTALGGATHQMASARVVALAEGAMKSLKIGKLTLVLGTLLMLGLFGAAGASVWPFAPSTLAGVDPAANPQGLAPPVQEPAPVKDALGDPLPPGAVARLGTVRWRHAGPVQFVALSPGGKAVVTAANDRFVRVWDFATGKELQRFGPGPRIDPRTGPGLLTSMRLTQIVVAVSPDGKLLAAQFEPETIQLWEIATGKKLQAIPGDAAFEVGAMAFAPDGKHLALASINGPVRLWDLDAGKVTRVLGRAPKESRPSQAARQSVAVFAPDGKTLVSVLSELDMMDVINRIQFWDPETGQERFSVNVVSRFGIESPTFSPDGKLFAYATHDAKICLVRAAGGEQLRSWKASPQPSESILLAFAADSARLYSKATVGEIQEWDVKTGKKLRRLGGHAGSAMTYYRSAGPDGCLTVAADGKTLAIGGGNNALRFVDLATGKELPATGSMHGLLTIGYTKDGKYILSRASNGAYRMWDAASGAEAKQPARPKQGNNFITTPDGRYWAVEGKDREVILVDTTSGEELARILTGNKLFPFFLFAPEGKTLLVRAVDQTVATLYDVPSGKERCKVAVPMGSVSVGGVPGRALAIQYFFSADGRRLAVHTAGKPLVIHDTATGQVTQKIPLGDYMVFAGSFAPDGRSLVLDRGNGMVQLIEVATGKERASLGNKLIDDKQAAVLFGTPPLTYGTVWAGSPPPCTVAFSPDGRLLAHGGPDQALRIYSVATGQLLAKFEGHTGPIASVVFAPDGRSVASASSDTTILVWNVAGLSERGRRSSS